MSTPLLLFNNQLIVDCAAPGKPIICAGEYTYYVDHAAPDGGDGTEINPWNNINQAFNATTYALCVSGCDCFVLIKGTVNYLLGATQFTIDDYTSYYYANHLHLMPWNQDYVTFLPPENCHNFSNFQWCDAYIIVSGWVMHNWEFVLEGTIPSSTARLTLVYIYKRVEHPVYLYNCKFSIDIDTTLPLGAANTYYAIHLVTYDARIIDCIFNINVAGDRGLSIGTGRTGTTFSYYDDTTHTISGGSITFTLNSTGQGCRFFVNTFNLLNCTVDIDMGSEPHYHNALIYTNIINTCDITLSGWAYGNHIAARKLITDTVINATMTTDSSVDFVYDTEAITNSTITFHCSCDVAYQLYEKLAVWGVRVSDRIGYINIDTSTISVTTTSVQPLNIKYVCPVYSAYYPVYIYDSELNGAACYPSPCPEGFSCFPGA